MNKQRLLELAGITEGIQARTKQTFMRRIPLRPGTWRVMWLDLYDHTLMGGTPKDVHAEDAFEAIIKALPHEDEENLKDFSHSYEKHTLIVSLEESDIIATLLR